MSLENRMRKMDPLEFSLYLHKITTNPNDHPGIKLTDFIHLNISTDEKIMYIERLLDFGYDVNEEGINKYTPLFSAFRTRDQNLCKFLINRGANIHLTVGGGTALKHAMDSDMDIIVEILINNGVTTLKESFLNNSLMGYAVYSNAQKVIKTLHRLGYSVHEEVSQGFTPLMWAVRYKQVEATKILIACGADVNKQCRRGMYPIELLTFEYGDKALEVAKILYAHGAETDFLTSEEVFVTSEKRTFYDTLHSTHRFKHFLDKQKKKVAVTT